MNTTDTDGMTPLMVAAMHEDRNLVREMLARGADVHAADSEGRTTLMWALPQPEVVKLLLSTGAEVNAQDRDGYTALMLLACSSESDGWVATARLLLRAGADSNLKSRRGETALSLAREAGNRRLEWLLEHVPVRDLQ